MNIKIILTGLLASVALSSCLDCMDCQITTDVNLSVEYYSNSNDSLILDSISSIAYSGPGYVMLSDDNMSTYLSPTSDTEACGDDLKDINNSTLTFETTVGDSTSGLYKYNWTESWECK